MGDLYIVGTPIGNLADLTHRAVEVLRRVDRILAEDTRRTRVLLDHYGIATPLTSLHEHNEAARTEEALGRLAGGEALALVSDAGTPLLSDPGARLVDAAVGAGHRVVPIPGPSAITAALVASGLPPEPFAFLGFVPKGGGGRSALLDRVATAGDTTVLFESPERLSRLLADLEAVCGPGRRVAVARELTKVHEEIVRGTLSEARAYYEEKPPRGEVTVVVEGAAARGEPDRVDEAAAEALARALLEEGRRPSAAAREVAARLGIPRNRAYEIVHRVAG